jgi:3-phosphoshikimate 1-carboxyvinyltransferase
MSVQLRPARRLRGEITVLGEHGTAARALLIACLSHGESRIGNAPPSVAPLFEGLRRLGVKIRGNNGHVQVSGREVGSLDPASEVLDLASAGSALPIVLALLGGQAFTSRVRLGDRIPAAREFLTKLAPMGISWQSISDDLIELGGQALVGCELAATDLEMEEKLAVLVAALHASGTTWLTESASQRDSSVPTLRQRGVVVERQKLENGSSYRVGVDGGQAVQPTTVELAGDLELTSAFLAVALSLNRSQVVIRNVEVRSGRRSFFDLMRQLGGVLELVNEEDGHHRVEARSGSLKATRIAGTRVEKLLDQLPLVAVVATQTQGEFVIRDIERLRQGPQDRVAHLVEQLRAMEAKVGEFPEGIVIKGGYPLRGARIDCAGDPALAQAFAAAGLLAADDTELEGTEALESLNPKFFETLASITEEKK